MYLTSLFVGGDTMIRGFKKEKKKKKDQQLRKILMNSDLRYIHFAFIEILYKIFIKCASCICAPYALKKNIDLGICLRFSQSYQYNNNKRCDERKKSAQR